MVHCSSTDTLFDGYVQTFSQLLVISASILYEEELKTSFIRFLSGRDKNSRSPIYYHE